jgi:hypothetical protein
MNGQSNREIATAEEIDRETVGRILSQHEVVEMVAQYRSRLLGMVRKAIGVFDQALVSDDERVQLAAATKLLEGLGVLPKGGIEQPAPEPDRAQQRTLVLGQFMEVLVAKKQRYGIPLPPEFDGLDTELKRLEGPTS